MAKNDLATRLELALGVRSASFDAEHSGALRLFAGFYEGCPDLAVDLYAHTLVLFDYGKDGGAGDNNLSLAQDFYLAQIPWIECVVQKTRGATNLQSSRGVITYGDTPSSRITEHGITYAIDLLMNQDASFYIDTRGLRGWLIKNAAKWQVLNTFAYTGSLGVAALAGNAARVVQTDRSKKFLAMARISAMSNRLDLGKMKLRGNDFFSEVARLKRTGDQFDCVILDPPFFSSTSKGTVDLVNQSTRLINKVRPLIKDGGCLITVNNALFLSGQDYLQSLNLLSKDGYLTIGDTIPIPEDITGFPETIVNHPPSDPTPFNHPTKIVLLQVKRKA